MASRTCAPQSRSSTSVRSRSVLRRRWSRSEKPRPLLPAASSPKAEAPDPPRKLRKIRGLQWSGRLDLNQRPLAPQAAQEAAQPLSTLPNPSESFAPAPDSAVQGSQRSAAFRRNFATNLLPPIEQLLTVRQVAQFLRVCPATVYKWAASGVLPHVRIVNMIRVSPEH